MHFQEQANASLTGKAESIQPLAVFSANINPTEKSCCRTGKFASNSNAALQRNRMPHMRAQAQELAT